MYNDRDITKPLSMVNSLFQHSKTKRNESVASVVGMTNVLSLFYDNLLGPVIRL